jgi:hypothetical protein
MFAQYQYQAENQASSRQGEENYQHLVEVWMLWTDEIVC